MLRLKVKSFHAAYGVDFGCDGGSITCLESEDMLVWTQAFRPHEEGGTIPGHNSTYSSPMRLQPVSFEDLLPATTASHTSRGSGTSIVGASPGDVSHNVCCAYRGFYTFGLGPSAAGIVHMLFMSAHRHQMSSELPDPEF